MLIKRNRITNQQIALIAATATVAVMCLFLVFCNIAGDGLAFREEPCYMFSHYHLYCPSCGGTRALKLLASGRIISSLLSNPIPLYAAGIVMRIWITLIINNFFRKNKTKFSAFTVPEIWAIPAVIFLFFVLRNVFLVSFGIDYLGDLSSFWV
ncbi:MAG: DUF2752 domain-containing protein [Clostridiales bacterium]|nr:DUF2752 domain-containing protein [Clostridiales bacterium]